jgi:uncharacterized protein YndB with AHSA1/START domain
MTRPPKTIAFKFERIIRATPNEVFEAWLNPSIPGNLWHAADKLILDPKVDGLFFWRINGTAHYGRFTAITRPGRIQHTWMSPNTLGQESLVTLTFKKQGEDTLMTLAHTDLPHATVARSHEKGWNYFLGIFCAKFGQGPAKKSAAKKK